MIKVIRRHIRNVAELRQFLSRLCRADIRCVAQVNHDSRKFGKILRLNAHLSGNGKNRCNAGCVLTDLFRHYDNLFRQVGKLTLSGFNCLFDICKSRLIINRRLNHRLAGGENRCCNSHRELFAYALHFTTKRV